MLDNAIARANATPVYTTGFIGLASLLLLPVATKTPISKALAISIIIMIPRSEVTTALKLPEANASLKSLNIKNPPNEIVVGVLTETESLIIN